MKIVIGILIMSFCAINTTQFFDDCYIECHRKLIYKCGNEIQDIQTAAYFMNNTDDKELKKAFEKIATDKMEKVCPKTVDKYFKELLK